MRLTRAQELIWTGQRLQPDDPLYNMVLAFHIGTALDADAFERAFRALLQGCGAMRTVIDEDAGESRQRVLETMDFALETVDFSSRRDPREALAAWLEARARRPFDYARRLFDTALLYLSAQESVWYFNQHHVVTDAWSVSVIFRHMSALYQAARSGLETPTPALPPYRDYVEYERRHQDSRACRRAREYWRAKGDLSGPVPQFYRRPAPTRSGRTRRYAVALGADRSRAIRALAEAPAFRAFNSDLARFQIFFTALAVYLYRITGVGEVVIGTPAHNRSSKSFKQTAGLFIEIFPLTLTLSADDTFASVYQQVAREARAFLLNAQPGASGFDQVRGINVVLNYITAEFGEFDAHPTTAEWVHAGYGDRNHVLRLQVHDFDQADVFGLFLDLNEDSFSVDDADAARRHLLAIIDAFVDQPEGSITAVNLLDAAARRALLSVARGRIQTSADRTLTLGARFEHCAARHRDLPALECDGVVWNYGSLNSDANRLAHELRARGIGAGDVVALGMRRSAEAVIAMLAVIKCGAAYLPLSTNDPGARRAHCVADAGARLWLVDSAAGQPRDERWATEVYADFARAAAGRPDSNPAPVVTANDRVYVIYTSGSSGAPKGVAVTHANVVNYLDWAERQYVRGAQLTFPLFTAMAFDLTVTTCFLPLLSGGRVLVYPELEGGRDIVLRRVIEDNRADIIKLTPAHLALLQAMDLTHSRLRVMILGGDDLKTDVARTVSKYFNDEIEIYNEYGPTEATVGCMIHRFDPHADTDISVPIGRPIDGATIYVLDSRLGLQPRGVAGEIAIGGAGVALGYLGRDEETAARFVDDPFNRGGRMYLSGDLARWNADGRLEYLGRIDQQVKVNGIRIELGEIESVLAAYPGLREAVVIADDREARAQEIEYCVHCGLASNHPDADLDGAGVCGICRRFAREREQAMRYFGDQQDLENIVAEVRAATPRTPDCMMLLSGGKDSTYALCQLVDLGLTPLVFTLDNGYISDGAKDNIRRVVDKLGLELVSATTPAMDAIFVDSLKRHSNVCNGCFKTIYTLSMNLAHERGIRHIFTGLSRGQIFETRVADQFRQKIYDPAEIDRNIIEARKIYHRMHDAVSAALDVSLFRSDRVFEEIKFVDFYRYCDATLGDMLDYLQHGAPWVRPADTGRSTNCLINEAGIHVHKTERRHHNYALPYSWDVRLGHKERNAALAELDDDINIENVRRILASIGYHHQEASAATRRHIELIAYYVADDELDRGRLLEHLGARLPSEYLPRHFVRLEAVPLTGNGKLDRARLPAPQYARTGLDTEFVAPVSRNEHLLAGIWCEVFGLARIGINDNFFDLGGDSILNIQIVARARAAGLELTPQDLFDFPTVAAAAAVCRDVPTTSATQGPVEGEVELLPMQRRFFELAEDPPPALSQVAVVEVDAGLEVTVLTQAWAQVVAHHDVLRSRFERRANGWRQCIDPPSVAATPIPGPAPGEESASDLDALIDAMNGTMDIERGPLVQLRWLPRGADQPASLLVIAVHHLLIDGVSWWILLDDLERACQQLAAHAAVTLPRKTTAVADWALALAAQHAGSAGPAEAEYWAQIDASVMTLRCDYPESVNDYASSTRLTSRLDREQTAALVHQVPASWRVQVPEVLLAGVVRVLARWHGGSLLKFDLEGHGREALVEGMDLTRTVGWFTSIYPVLFECRSGETLIETVRQVKEKLRAVPAHGAGYNLLHYGAERVSRAGSAPVLFNYLGQWDRATRGDARVRLSGPLRAVTAATGPRPYLLEINAYIFDGRLRLDWSYAADCYRPSTIQHLAGAVIGELGAIIELAASGAVAALTPSDFPAADVDQGELDRVLAEFGE